MTEEKNRGVLDKVLEEQVGGTHYMQGAVQPIHLILSQQLPFAEGSVIKYICRHRRRAGAHDLRKAVHYIRMILADTYGQLL